MGDDGNQQELSSLEKRIEREHQWRSEGLSLIPYRMNYFFPVTYNFSPADKPDGSEYNQLEAKYQFSAKVLLVNDLFKSDSHLYFGYTQLSMWQVYDRDDSAPFRDTNYEPEVFVRVDKSYGFGGFGAKQVDIGLNHQSNGQADPTSRSWNRIYANAILERKGMILMIKPWYRIPESADRDDNPDIHRFLGYGEVSVAYARKNHLLSFMFRNNLSTKDNKGAIQADYTFPLTRILNGLFQVFSGYGESLIDYNHSNTRLSVGIALSPWN